MNEQAVTTEDRRLAQALAFASREFDRAVDLLVGSDEPGEQEVRAAAGKEVEPAAKREKPEKKGGLVRQGLGAVAGVGRGVWRIVTGSVHPRHENWEAADLDSRIDWWVDRFGTAGAAVAAVPGLAGRLGRVVAIGDFVGAATQILVVNAVAHEMGVDSLDRRVAVAARIVLARDLNTGELAGALDPDEAQPEADAPGEAPEERRGPIRFLGSTAALVWRVAQRVWRLRSDLGNRRQGGAVLRLLTNLPAVGAPAAFLSERSGASRAARDARAAFASEATSA